MPYFTTILPHTSLIPKATLDAYRKAHYQVCDTPAFTLQIDQYSAELQSLYNSFQARSAAFLTACNPYSQLQSELDNRAAQQQLEAVLMQSQLRYFQGFSSDPNGQWEDEPSFLVLDLSAERSKELAKRFRQNALVWANKQAVPHLILLR